jgi:GT2 family glycosyltransferase
MRGGDDTPAPASIVICSRNRPELLRATVESVLDGDLVPIELVIVDQSGVPDPELAALDEVRGCRVRYLHSATVGLSRARNIGLRAAGEPLAVMIDDDMLVEADWLAELLGGLPDDPAALVTGRVLAAPNEVDGAGSVLPAAALVERDRPAVYRGLQQLDVVPGANVGVPRETVLALGGYDERLGAGTRFHAADDNDIGHRLLLAGCEVHHVPGAVVLHRAWRPRRELVRLRWRYGRGKGAFYAKHAGLRERTILRRALRDLAARMKRAAVSLVRAPRTSAAELVSAAGIVSGAVDWLVTERIPAALRGQGR